MSLNQSVMVSAGYRITMWVVQREGNGLCQKQHFINCDGCVFSGGSGVEHH